MRLPLLYEGANPNERFLYLVWMLEGYCPDTQRSQALRKGWWWCGCGDGPVAVYGFIRDMLVNQPWLYTNKGKMPGFDTMPSGAKALLMECFGNMGLTEHGSSWGASYLTAFGEYARDTLAPMSDDAICDGDTDASEFYSIRTCDGEGCTRCVAFGGDQRPPE